MTYKIIIVVSIIAVSLFIVSCVDVNTTNIPTGKDYRSLVRFIHLAGDNQSSTPVTMDGVAVSTLSFGATSGYLDSPAGSRVLGFTGATQLENFSTDNQYTVLIHSLSGTVRFLKLQDGYVFKNNGSGKTDTTQIRFIHIAKGFNATVQFREGSISGTDVNDASYLSAAGFTELPSGAHTFYAVSDGGYTASIDSSQAPSQPSTTTSGTASISLTVDNGLSYSISLDSDPRDSFYTAAHFHYGAVGTSGDIFLPIDVSQQVIGFPDPDSLEEEYEVPADTTTTAAGAGTFTFKRDTLEYSITLTRGSEPGLFTFGHFNNAPAGVNGPVVKTITTTPVGDTTLTGVWTSSDALQPLTPSLITELLAGRIYVNFHSATHPGGEIRAQLVPIKTTNVYSGSWADIPDSTKDSIIAGHVYINFHNGANPDGRVRGQVVVDPSVGHYGVASLATTDTSFAQGRMFTVVVTEVGTKLQMSKWSDRQFGVTKTVVQSQSVGVVHNPGTK